MTIEEMLTAKEGENFEFKTAENRFSYTELQKYACAISNEGGGKIVFGITDKRPRQIKGSKAFGQPERTRKGLIDSLHINIDFEVFNDGTEKRVLGKKPPELTSELTSGLTSIDNSKGTESDK